MAMIETIAVTKSGRRTKVTFRGLDAALSFEAEADDPGNVRVGLVHSLGGGVVISVVLAAADALRVASQLRSVAREADTDGH